MGELRIVEVRQAEFAWTRWEWPFARECRAAIDAHFVECRQRVPKLWNGQVLLLKEYALSGTCLRGEFFETDFASFLAWRDWNFPDSSVTNCFAAGAIRTADDRYLLGVMGRHTANAGRVYFPCGTPEPQDIAGKSVDLAANVEREVAEETGLVRADLAIEPGWCAVFAGPRLALMRTMRSHLLAEQLRANVLSHIAAEPHPELADVHIVRTRDDFVSTMPAFVTQFLDHVLPR